jgi:glutamate-ammonia-ligase adenylyltransferase
LAGHGSQAEGCEDFRLQGAEQMTNDHTKKWDEFRIAAENAGIKPPDIPEQIAAIRRIFSFSDFIARTCIRHPDMLDHLITGGDLLRQYPPDEYQKKLEASLSGIEDETALGSMLRGIRCREMLRIAWRDIAGHADLWETMRDLSSFAEACVDQSLSMLYQWQCSAFGIPTGADGEPQQLVVLGMGKLGAGELNFSSDIDLIFAYPEPGQTKGGEKSVTNDEFFVRLCRRLLTLLSANTSEGIVFRVDMDLRPYGESGPLVMNFDAMETYYQIQGREWERYAWIKARVIAGDKAAGARLLRRMNPFVYRKYLDFGVFESLREMKQKISLEVKRKGMKDNIKLGPGGIREIEFFGQIFQLIRGGVIHSLQSRPIQKILRTLAEEGYITQEVCQELEAAYVFLRNTEHRLQEFSDLQTHKLPPDSLKQGHLAASLGFPDWDAFASELEKHRKNVHGHFRRLLEAKDSEGNENDLKSVWQNLNSGESGRKIAEAGFADTEAVMQLLNHLHEDLSAAVITREARERIDRLIPLLLKEIGTSDPSAVSLNRITELIKTIKKRTSYIALLLENPAALSHLVRLAKASPWIISLLTRHPVLLDELLDSRTLYLPPRRPSLEKEICKRLEQFSSDDLEEQMEELRVFKQINTLRVAAADITDALALMKVSDHLSDIAETVLNQVIQIAWNQLIAKHGEPVCRLNRDTFTSGFAVIAYGKLGGLELGYGSDLDLVFLHAGTSEETKGGPRPIDSAQFFSRLGQRMIHILTTHTPAGILYETDMRLRPSGSSGLLVCHIDAFRTYQINEAWTWEKQAIIKARPVSGDPRMVSRFDDIRREALAQARDKTELRKEVRNMRMRMRKELLKPQAGIFDLKQDPGGMVDIEFLVQYLVLLNAHKYPDLVRWTDNVRLIGTLANAGIIDDITAYILRKAYLTYRIVGHRLSLREQAAAVPEERFRLLREKIEELWEVFMEK